MITATFIIARVKIYASAFSDGSTEFCRCDVNRGNLLSIEQLFCIDGVRTVDRIFNVPAVMEVEHEYEVIIRFLNPRFIIPHLAVGKRFELVSAGVIGEGTVIEIHDYGDLLTAWGSDESPWRSNGVKRPDYYITTRLVADGKIPIACFVRREHELIDGVVHEVAIDPTLNEETARTTGLPNRQLIVMLPKRAVMAGEAVLLSGDPADSSFWKAKKIADCQIHPTWAPMGSDLIDASN